MTGTDDKETNKFIFKLLEELENKCEYVKYKKFAERLMKILEQKNVFILIKYLHGKEITEEEKNLSITKKGFEGVISLFPLLDDFFMEKLNDTDKEQLFGCDEKKKTVYDLYLKCNIILCVQKRQIVKKMREHVLDCLSDQTQTIKFTDKKREFVQEVYTREFMLESVFTKIYNWDEDVEMKKIFPKSQTEKEEEKENKEKTKEEKEEKKKEKKKED